jgi:hypothetical protein
MLNYKLCVFFDMLTVQERYNISAKSVFIFLLSSLAIVVVTAMMILTVTMMTTATH